ncbi:MAG: glucan biosynthesis protein D, partial [Hyphomicrobiales bacterium]
MFDVNRRQLLASLAALGVALPFGKTAMAAESALVFGEAKPYSFEALVEETRALAASPYVPEVPRFGDVLEAIDYDQHQRIQFLSGNTLELNGGESPVRFFHLGRYFK